MEEQADYRLVTDRKVCPLMSKADPDNPREVQPVFCLGTRCGMCLLCQGVHDRLDEIRNTVRNTLR